MKIGIDARMLGPGFGLARYVQQLVKHLAQAETGHEFVLFLRRENWEEVTLPLSGGVGGGRAESPKDGLTERPTLTPPHRGGRFTKALADMPWYSLEEQTKFSGIIKREGIDLMHFPHWNVPYFYSGPYVVTIHDLTMYHFPRPAATTLGPLKFWLKDRAHRMLLKRVTKKAHHIITTSEFTRQDVHRTLRVPMEKMTTTYQAPFENPGSRDVEPEADVLQAYGVTKPYVMYVGAAYPHKNLEGLLEAWKLFEEKHGDEYQLVLVGKENHFYSKLLGSPAMNQCNNVVYTGFVPDEELVALYDNASLYVFPSMYEGFGLPPLEAMSHGVPVVSSNRSCLPEVLGEGALYFDPESAEQMAEVIERGLEDGGVRAELKQKGREEVRKYSWEKLAKKTLGIYNDVVKDVMRS